MLLRSQASDPGRPCHVAADTAESAFIVRRRGGSLRQTLHPNPDCATSVFHHANSSACRYQRVPRALPTSRSHLLGRQTEKPCACSLGQPPGYCVIRGRDSPSPCFRVMMLDNELGRRKVAIYASLSPQANPTSHGSVYHARSQCLCLASRGDMSCTAGSNRTQLGMWNPASFPSGAGWVGDGLADLVAVLSANIAWWPFVSSDRWKHGRAELPLAHCPV